MKTKAQIITEIEQASKTDMKIALYGLRIIIGDEVSFYTTIKEMIEDVKKIDTKNLYKMTVDVSKVMFMMINVRVEYLTSKEVNHPLNLVKIARNKRAINESNYERCDARNTYQSFSELKRKIDRIMCELSNNEIEIINSLI